MSGGASSDSPEEDAPFFDRFEDDMSCTAGGFNIGNSNNCRPCSSSISVTYSFSRSGRDLSTDEIAVSETDISSLNEVASLNCASRDNRGGDTEFGDGLTAVFEVFGTAFSDFGKSFST